MSSTIPCVASWSIFKDVFRLWNAKEISRHCLSGRSLQQQIDQHIVAKFRRECSYLKPLRPLPHIVVVLASVLGVEVGERARVFLVVPDLPKDGGIDVTHENLADGIKTMCYDSQYGI